MVSLLMSLCPPNRAFRMNNGVVCWKKKPYQERLVGIAIDEAHCIVEWGTSSNNKKNTAFRIWYSRLNELRSLVGKGVLFMALTATATKRTKRQIFDMLELINPFEVVDNPNRPNICFVVQKNG